MLGSLFKKNGFFDPSVIDRIRNVSWFEMCGKPVVGVKFLCPISRLQSWAEAEDACTSDDWENIGLEAQGQLTVHLSRNFPKRYQNWNTIVKAAKSEVIDSLEKSIWHPYFSDKGLKIDFVHSVRWNVLGALMENAYRDVSDGPAFFTHLLTIYEAGHIPCGVRGGYVPGDQLLVW